MAADEERRAARIKELDEQIEAAEARVQSLQYLLKVQMANALSIQYSYDRASSQDSAHEQLEKLCQIHQARNQQCLYRICAGVTAFKVADPDPNAVDQGKVLGLRFEVMSKSQFIHPFFVMLNRPWLPEHLPPPDEEVDGRPPKQDLAHFARTLRQELVCYHNRIGAIADLRRDIGITGNEGVDQEAQWLVDVSAADSEAKQIRLEWSNGRTGRVVMDADGVVKQLVVFGPEGRDRETMRALWSDNLRIEDFSGKLTQLRQKEWRRELELENEQEQERETEIFSESEA
ncbi:unnamed protein product [Parascedosporium putredinis]|uniref:Cenp-o kinetochore centromere component n=1 Tax=Parascedosporium putredinis TaxID=1442378 RepID=A0A9P1GW56_9PEZI|nr:unnamed protein product [Parascedosporium putredinis]CAI7988178.1 unnamed protein product [Parascedosporium putredinis]